MKVNVGCGYNPTPDWVNIDNSPTVLLAKTPLRFLLHRRASFAAKVREHDIRYGNALHLSLPDRSADVLYAAHLIEHFDRAETDRFLAEVRRVLKPGGLLRLTVPDLRRQVAAYLAHGDADAFLAYSELTAPRPRSLSERLRLALFGHRGHMWMYDRPSLRKLLDRAGFASITGLDPGETAIPDPGALDLRERESESLYIECLNPGSARIGEGDEGRQPADMFPAAGPVRDIGARPDRAAA